MAKKQAGSRPLLVTFCLINGCDATYMLREMFIFKTVLAQAVQRWSCETVMILVSMVMDFD